MADIFKNTELGFGGAFTADKGLISGGKLTGVMMQQLSLQYQQQVTRIYEIGEQGASMTNIYYIGGRSSGTMQVAHVVGPKLAMKAYYDEYSDVCAAAKNDISLKLTKVDCNTKGGGTKTITYIAKYCVLVQIGMSVSAQDMVINENSQIMFSNLDLTET